MSRLGKSQLQKSRREKINGILYFVLCLGCFLASPGPQGCLLLCCLHHLCSLPRDTHYPIQFTLSYLLPCACMQCHTLTSSLVSSTRYQLPSFLYVSSGSLFHPLSPSPDPSQVSKQPAIPPKTNFPTFSQNVFPPSQSTPPPNNITNPQHPPLALSPFHHPNPGHLQNWIRLPHSTKWPLLFCREGYEATNFTVDGQSWGLRVREY